jgi:LuxR family maltose regulon positive regulatory protein
MLSAATDHPHLRAVAPLAPAVARDRLVGLLRAARTGHVVVLRAPAGFGKTTLLRAWEARDPRPFLWHAGGRGAAWAAGLDALAGEAWDGGQDAVLVLDGAEQRLGAPARRAVAAVADRVPDGSLLVLASRGAPVLALGRRRIAGDVLELGARDLALTRGELAGALRAADLDPGEAAVEALAAATEGWPAAVSLAAMVLADAADPDEAARRFGGGEPAVADYVREEVLAAAGPALERFLVRTSVLEVLEADTCDAVLDTVGSRAALDELADSAVPVTPVDRTAERLRCHPLVLDVLRRELRRREPGVEPVLQRRAAAAFERAGLAEAALRHALAAGDLDHAGRLLWHAAPELAFGDREAALERWLGALPEGALRERSALALAAATQELVHGTPDRAAHWTAVGADRLGHAPAALRPDLEGAIAVLDGLLLARSTAVLHAQAADADRTLPPVSPWRAVGCLLEGAARWLEGHEAREVFEEGARRGLLAAPAITALCQAELALGALAGEDWEEGARLAERAAARTAAVGLADSPLLALVRATAAFARAHRGRLDEARLDAAAARRLLDGDEDPVAWLAAQAHLAVARAELRLGDITAAREALRRACRAGARIADPAGLRALLDDAERRLGAFGAAALEDADALTTAELRVLRFLPSHLSFREIGADLHVSPNTIKTQAHAVYRKLGASSRSRAVDRARSLGLLDLDARSPGSDDVQRGLAS